MTFSNPAGTAAAAAPTYVRALLDVLGRRDPLEVMPELVPWVEARFGVLDAVLRRPEAPGKWSVIEVIQHLADSDLVFGFRVRMMLSEDRPPLPDTTRTAGPTLFGYRDAPPELALDQLAGCAQPICALVRRFAGPAARVGLHSERGRRASASCYGSWRPTTWFTGGRSTASWRRSAMTASG